MYKNTAAEVFCVFRNQQVDWQLFLWKTKNQYRCRFFARLNHKCIASICFEFVARTKDEGFQGQISVSVITCRLRTRDLITESG